MPTAAELRADILSGTRSATLAPLFAAGNDTAIADDYATLAGTLRQRWVDRGRFLLDILPAVIAIPYLADSAKRSMWQLILGVVQSSEWIEITHQRTQALLAMAVADGLLTQAQADSVGVRPATRAELLWGEGATVSAADVGEARKVGE